jgi:hypothetical protein
MPLHWTIDPERQLVTVRAEGPVSREEADAYLDAVDERGAISYRKLYDGRAGELGMDQQELMAISARFRSYHHLPVGALAIVLADDKLEVVGRMLGILATADRPMKLFSSLTAARRWLDNLGPASPPQLPQS